LSADRLTLLIRAKACTLGFVILAAGHALKTAMQITVDHDVSLRVGTEIDKSQ
jgi:hypothetical protein